MLYWHDNDFLSNEKEVETNSDHGYCGYCHVGMTIYCVDTGSTYPKFFPACGAHIDNFVGYCHECNKALFDDDDYEIFRPDMADSEMYCSKCYEEFFAMCEGCFEDYDKEYMTLYDDCYYCEACIEELSENEDDE